jgi:hypothetical protein
MDEDFLLNNRSGATVAGAKRRTVVAIVVLVTGFTGNLRFFDVFVQRLIDTRNHRETNDVNR